MRCQLEVDDNQLIFLPRPWLEVEAAQVREAGAVQTWSCGTQLYVKGLVGRTVLPFWHRAVAVREGLAVA